MMVLISSVLEFTALRRPLPADLVVRVWRQVAPVYTLRAGAVLLAQLTEVYRNRLTDGTMDGLVPVDDVQAEHGSVHSDGDCWREPKTGNIISMPGTSFSTFGCLDPSHHMSTINVNLLRINCL